MAASRVEIDGRDPVTVTLASHDVFTGFHVPDLPSTIVTGRSNDLLSLMESHATDATRVCRNGVDSS